MLLPNYCIKVWGRYLRAETTKLSILDAQYTHSKSKLLFWQLNLIPLFGNIILAIIHLRMTLKRVFFGLENVSEGHQYVYLEMHLGFYKYSPFLGSNLQPIPFHIVYNVGIV
jgi:hypothetical protein